MGSGDITLYYRDLYEPFSLSQLSLDRLALLRRTYMLYDFILFFFAVARRFSAIRRATIGEDLPNGH